MKETAALVRIQEIDLALMRHKRTLGSLPQSKKIQTIHVARKKLAQEISKIVGLRKDAEMDLEENETSHARLEEVVLEVQEKFDSGTAGYRELADLESQLTSLAKRIEKREFKHKELVARLDKVKTAERNARAMDERLVAEEEAQRQSLHEQAADIERDVRMLTREREEAEKSVSSEVMATYLASFKRFGGLAVETLKGNMPSVCSVAISPSAFADIRRGPAITECPYCHRMLVTDGMFDFNE